MKASITRFGLAASEKEGSQDAFDAVVLPNTILAVMADGAGAADGAKEAATKTVSSVVANFKTRPRAWSGPKALDEFARLANRTLHQESLPPWLDSVVLRAIGLAPEDRYQSYSEMKFDLENPAKVKPWFRPDASMLEKNALLFYKVGFFILLSLNIYLLLRWVLD